MTIQPVLSYQLSSAEADTVGNHLLAFEIRYHGRVRYESFDGTFGMDISREQQAAGRMPLATAQAYQFEFSAQMKKWRSDEQVRNEQVRDAYIANNTISSANIRQGRDVRTTVSRRPISECSLL